MGEDFPATFQHKSLRLEQAQCEQRATLSLTPSLVKGHDPR
jgi:hypothetical protein